MNIKFIKNTFLFGIALALNNFFPLILIPFYTSFFGIEFYGLFALSTAIISYVILISDYGFNVGAVRIASINKNKIKFVYSGVVACRLHITLFILIFLLFFLYFFDKSKDLFFISILLSLCAVFNIFSSQWIFVALDKLKEYAFISFISKIPSVFLLIILAFYKEVWLALLIAVIPFFMLNFLSFLYINKKLKVKLNLGFFKYKYLMLLMKSNRTYFLASAGGSLFNNVNIVLIGIFFGPINSGYYSIAEKIIKCLVFINAPITQMNFSRVAKNIQDFNYVKSIIRNSIVFQAGGMFLISLLFFIFIKFIEINDAFLIESEILYFLCIMAFAPFLTALSDIFGNNIMLNYGMNAQYSKIFIACGIFNILFITILSNFFDAKIVAYSFILSEIILCFSRAYFVFRYKNNLII